MSGAGLTPVWSVVGVVILSSLSISLSFRRFFAEDSAVLVPVRRGSLDSAVLVPVRRGSLDRGLGELEVSGMSSGMMRLSADTWGWV